MMQSEIPGGLLAVYKEKGWTSSDVVVKLRHILKIKKIGHAGTLDPEAEGVLPVLIGRGTKLSGMLMDTDKLYRAAAVLGIETDTQDLTGTILKDRREDAAYPGKDQIESAAAWFVGPYLQTPPMYSAKKVGGKKLYELARKGQEAERTPSEVYIHSLKVLSVDEKEHSFTFETACSKGTYIRTLCHDIGQKLGVGAAMKSLVRLRAAGCGIEDSLKIQEIEELAEKGRIGEKIIPVDEIFRDYGRVTVSSGQEKMLLNGNVLRLDVPDGKYRVYLPDGRFAALYEVTEKKAVLCGYFLT